MKKSNQSKKQADGNKGLKLPLIQSNIQKGNIKENKENLSKGKMFSKGSAQKNNIKETPPMPNINLNKNQKPLESSNLNQSSNKVKENLEINKKNSVKPDVKSQYINSQGNKPKFSEERLSQLKKQRKKRIIQERKEEKKEIEIYEKIVAEFKVNSKEKNSKNIQNKLIENNPKIIISSKKAQNILEEGGMLDAYKEVMTQLCKNGLPDGNIFEFASYVVKNYEKKWKEKKSKQMKDKIEQHYEKKQKEINKTLETEGIRIVNKSLEHRDELKFIQSLDKTRSKRNVVPRINTTPPKNDRFSYLGNNYIENLKLQNDSKKINKKKKPKTVISIIVKDSSTETDNQFETNNTYKSLDIRQKEIKSNNISANKKNIKMKK